MESTEQYERMDLLVHVTHTGDEDAEAFENYFRDMFHMYENLNIHVELQEEFNRE
jgi:hypothetical protein